MTAACRVRFAEHLAPFGKAAIGGQDHGALFVAGVDQLEEQIAAAGHRPAGSRSRRRSAAQRGREADPLAQPSLALGLGQRADEVGQREKYTLRPALTASTPSATAKWLLPCRSNQRHTAGCPAFEVRITYPFHPRSGEIVAVVGVKRHAGADTSSSGNPTGPWRCCRPG